MCIAARSGDLCWGTCLVRVVGSGRVRAGGFDDEVDVQVLAVLFDVDSIGVEAVAAALFCCGSPINDDDVRESRGERLDQSVVLCSPGTVAIYGQKDHARNIGQR